MDKNKLAKKFQEPAENLLMEIGTLAKTKTGLLDLSIGDPDLVTNARIIDQAAEDAKKGHTRYTASNGSDEFLQAVVDHYKKKYDLNFKTDQVFASVGALHGTYLALMAILDPQDEVIIHEPFFSPYKEQVELAGGKAVIVPTYEKDGFQLDPEILQKAITKKTKAIIINSPNNPTGAVFSKKTVQKIAEIAKENNLFVLSDEIYEEFVYQGEFTPMAKWAFDNTITISGFSKAFAMTGWRIGYIIAPVYVTQAMKLINENIAYSAPTLSQRAGIYALNHADELVSQVVDVFKERLTYVKKRVETIDFLELTDVKGSMYAFINVSKTGLNSVDFSKKLLDEKQVLVIPGKAFGITTGDQHVRLAATQDMTVLKEAFDRIETMKF
ncbi:MAG TPA: pyridoxal phosphate-dependent aminotransferase [Tetragenococcus sp.]|nr:pyridoxal phosphate-dependent aminotransferase [Tetragenococcus sp.]